MCGWNDAIIFMISEIKDCRKRKDTARELEGIDMSNIISSSRRRSTFSFVTPERPGIRAKKGKLDSRDGKKKENNDTDKNDDSEEEEKKEEKEKEEEVEVEDEKEKEKEEEVEEEDEEEAEEVEDDDDDEEEEDEGESEDFNEGKFW